MLMMIMLHCYSIFSRVTLTSNGGVLEDFNKCNVYIPVVYDLTIDSDTRNNYYSFFGNSTTPVGATATAAPNIETCKTGAEIISVALAAAGSSAARSFGFIIPSIIGSFSKKLFPISEIVGSNVDLDMYLDTQVNAIVASGTITATEINRMRLNLSVVVIIFEYV